MKVVHLCAWDHDGALQTTMRLHESLRAFGAESRVLALQVETPHPDVEIVALRRAVAGQAAKDAVTARWRGLLRRYPHRPEGLDCFSGPRADVDLAAHPLVVDADVINLHWTAGLVDIPALPDILQGKTAVWTLHDMNPFTGGCHCSDGCRRFAQGCGACPQLGSDALSDISAAFLAEKTATYAKTAFAAAAPSRWLAALAKDAPAFSGHEVLVIPNGLDVDLFAPAPGGPVRAALGLSPDDFVLLYDAGNACRRRGGELLRRLVDGLPASVQGRRLVLAVFGALEGPGAGGAVRTVNLGRLQDPRQLVQAYAMADVLLAPPLEDNLPKTVLEAMSCGVPAVGFAAGGLTDLVRHGVDGWLAEPGDLDGLLRGLWEALRRGPAMGQAARQTIVEGFSQRRQVWAYLDLYAKGVAEMQAASVGPIARTGNPSSESSHAHQWLDGLSGIEIGPAAHNPFGLDTRNVGLRHAGYYQEQLRRTGRLSPLHVEAPADALPLPSESEDFVLSSHVVEHCPDLIRALLEWYRVLKPGGLLYMVTPKRDAAPSDRGKPLTAWRHVLEDFDNRQTPEKETQAGSFGYCHYHVFTPRTLRGFMRQIFGDRLALVDALDTDDKVGNGFVLVYRKASRPEDEEPWLLGAGDASRRLARRACGPWERIDAADLLDPAAFAASDQAAGRAASIDELAEAVLRQGGAAAVAPLPGKALLALAAFAAKAPDMAARQQACLRTLEPLGALGLEVAIPCLEVEVDDVRAAFPGVRVEPRLTHRADQRLGVPGRPKPFVDEYFDAACDMAVASGLAWFGFANSDLLFAPELAAELGDAMARGEEAVVVSRTELSRLDAEGKPIPGYLEFAGYDAFFCRTDWWRAHRRRFSPYIIGERGWDDAYAAVLLTHARCRLLWRPGLLWHPEHERRWNLEDTAYGDWNMGLYSGRDVAYARRFEAFIEDVLALETKRLPQGEALTAAINRNFRDIPEIVGDQARFVNIVMVTFNRLAFTRQAIGSILRTTDWPYRLTVVDNGSSDGSQEYLKELRRKGLIHNLILNPENLGVARAANQGWLAEPGAAFMLKYDNDIVMQQPGWLSPMIRVCDALPGVGALAYNFEATSYPLVEIKGLRVRPNLRRSLGGACLLIPEATHAALGYWTEDFGLYSEEDADYCERTVKAGGLLVYMENEDVGLHLPGGKAAVIDGATFTARNGVEEIQEKEYRAFKDEQRRKGVPVRNALFKAYAAGLSPLRRETNMRLRRPLFEPAPVKRHRDEGRPLRVMTVAQDAHDAMAALRLVGPNALLARRGLIAWRLAPLSGDQRGLFWDPEAETAADVYVMPRDIAHAAGRAVIAFAKANGATALFDVDHFLVAPPAGGPEEAAFGACRSQMEDLALRSHGLIVPSPVLAEMLRADFPRVAAYSDYPDEALFPQDARPARDPGEPLVIGVVGQGPDDPELVSQQAMFAALLNTLKGRAVIEFRGGAPAPLANHPQARLAPAFPDDYARYAQALCRSGFDLALAPLADTPRNRAKSPIRLLEYALAGIPAVYSETAPYADVDQGVTGLLTADTPEGWIAAAVRLVTDAALRERIRTNARNAALASQCLKDNAFKLFDIYREMADVS